MLQKAGKYLAGYFDAFARLLRQEHIFMVAVASLIGALTGVAAVVFEWMIEWVHHFCYHGGILNMDSGLGSKALLLPLILGGGGLLVGVLSHFFNPSKETAAASEAMKWAAVDQKVPSRVIWYRSIVSAITIGTGGSGGREGPMVQLGAAIGNKISRVMAASSERRRLLLGCGTAGAIAAAFNAPLGGLIFAIEIILADFNIKVFSPLIFSSVIATVTARSINGDTPVFELPDYTVVSTWEMVFFLLLGILCGYLAALFYKSYFFFHDWFENMPFPAWSLPAIGGALVGVIGIFFPDVLGNGYESMSKVLTGKLALWLVFVLIFLKIVATSLTLGSRGSGGMFAPALFIGTMAGGAFGMLLNTLFPSITGPSGAYAMVGMGAVMSAAAHSPLTNILLAFELTNNYHIILPIMLACISSTFVYSSVVPNSIYQEKLRRVGITISQGREATIMNSIKVQEVMESEFHTIPEYMPFREIVKLISHSRDLYYPVVDREGNMTGIISVQDVREFMFQSELGDLVVAKELATESVISVAPHENLNDAMEKFAIRDLDELPVVSREEPGKVIGVVKRKDVISAYRRAVKETSI